MKKLNELIELKKDILKGYLKDELTSILKNSWTLNKINRLVEKVRFNTTNDLTNPSIIKHFMLTNFAFNSVSKEDKEAVVEVIYNYKRLLSV